MANDQAQAPNTVSSSTAPDVVPKKAMKKAATKKAGRKKKRRARKNAASSTPSRPKVGDRREKGYPSESLNQVLHLGESIVKFAGGDKIRRLTLMQKMERSPNSSAVRVLITNSAKYGVTTGSKQAEWIELTQD